MYKLINKISIILSNYGNPHISLAIKLTENLISYDNCLIIEKGQTVGVQEQGR